MEGVHVTEITWFNAKKQLPDNNRSVLVLFKHYQGSYVVPYLSQAKFSKIKGNIWEVDSKIFNPSIDIIYQWGEIDPKRGGCLPDDFPGSNFKYEFISNEI